MNRTNELPSLSLAETKLQSLPLGSIKPEGWLKNQLKIQANGFTGHLDEHWEDVGPNNGWLGGSGDSWERGPYYLDGLVPLAYLLEDQQLIEKARPWIEWTLNSQREDGSFGPNHLTTVNLECDDNVDMDQQDWWQEIIMLKVLTQYQEATNDERVIPFLIRYFHYLKEAIEKVPLREWAQARGADLLLSIQWLHEKTKDPSLLELAETVRTQTIDWSSIFAKFPYWRKQYEWNHRTHVVNVAMGIKAPAVFFRQTNDVMEKEAVYKGIESLMTYHGQAHGMFSGDEWLSGTHPSQGIELCAVVEYMFSLEQIIRILGDGSFADILEKVAFNALPAAISPTWDSHQYDQQVNQIMCNAAKRPWVNGPDANMFGLEPHFGCCTSNMHQGWPKFVTSLWMSTQDGGLAAISYAPCKVLTTVEKGIGVELTVQSDYPFREHVTIDLSVSKETRFPLNLRIPRWCKAPIIKVNGTRMEVQVENGFACLNQFWSNNDQIELSLPMEVELNERNNSAVSVERGPLVYVLPLGEQWVCVQERERFHDWEIYPKSAWRYALLENAEFKLETGELTSQPFRAETAPIKLMTKGQLISNWVMEKNSAGAPPLNPRPYEKGRAEALELVPYGCARLRIGEFPVIR
ncbi:beta-L-arabinofuranosidase domain-containing protein [Mesobacillus foraminis]|uniref:Beta-L-arabinofuranosidase (Glycosyl hydrolase family 127) n=1 Tax=Mesobacillus foraminis TaxID=279826 RepID=A0A4R2B3G9_9BACI|nr:beta-L-arabinofuranosidase domain-containing protein [Mesobacillus foraminis]TCN21158.1 beta-L-arabinofuranosidase (glycosyl hydrolase family 127) [Mesobacillus foraminis]